MKKKALKTGTKVVESSFVLSFILITSLFFLWGVANDMTNPMVSAFKKVMPELTNMQASFVQLAFYGGYATMAFPAALFIRRFSYKSGILLGLALYAIGALLFYPAAKFEDFGFFLASLYILTFGLAFLETTSNPFILSMGSPETATRRLNLSQTFNPLGSFVGMLVAQLFVIKLLKSSEYTPQTYNILAETEKAAIRTHDLNLISTPYIALGIFILLIFLLVALVKMPKQQTSDALSIKEALKKLFSNKRYYEGLVAQIFYVGAQIMCWTFIFQYVDNLNSGRPENAQLTATWYNMLAMCAFFFGRASSTYLMKFINPAKLMLIFAVMAMMLTIGVIFIVGLPGLYCLVGISVTMSLMFPTIYGLALKDMGDEAKLGSAGLVMAIVGGALMPPIQGRILDIGGSGFADKLFFGYIPEVNMSFALPLISFLVVAIYSYRSLKYHNHLLSCHG
ncbi:MAG: L-fucose:H+ symporter permease [Bacteroidales bacterium]|nr:L-fucose:H+ symporter permease [Bacteroidales bacterium]